MLFLLILEIIFLQARIGFIGIVGVLVTVIGVYLLNIEKAHVSFWKPFTLLLEDKGMKYALLSAIFMAPSFLFFKITVNLSDPFSPAFTNYLFATIFTLPAVLKLSRPNFKGYFKYWKGSVAMGLFAFLSTVLATVGYQQSFATYVEAVKQSEVIFALIAGVIFFKEKERVKEIWVGCLVIVIGICLIVGS